MNILVKGTVNLYDMEGYFNFFSLNLDRLYKKRYEITKFNQER